LAETEILILAEKSHATSNILLIFKYHLFLT